MGRKKKKQQSTVKQHFRFWKQKKQNHNDNNKNRARTHGYNRYFINWVFYLFVQGTHEGNTHNKDQAGLSFQMVQIPFLHFGRDSVLRAVLVSQTTATNEYT